MLMIYSMYRPQISDSKYLDRMRAAVKMANEHTDAMRSFLSYILNGVLFYYFLLLLLLTSSKYSFAEWKQNLENKS